MYLRARIGPLAAAAEDTPDSLAARVLAEEHRLYPEALRAIASGEARIIGERVVGVGIRGA